MARTEAGSDSHRTEQIFAKAHEHLQEKDAARERALTRSRQVIRLCADTTRTIHREEFEAAGELLSQAGKALGETREALEAHPDVLYAGFFADAEKEYAEATVTLAVVRGEELPSPEELGVEVSPYLNGVAEAIGEVRRRIIDKLRVGDVKVCAELLEMMDVFYSGIVSFDYPEAMLMGLRRRTDLARSIIERTRHDVTHAIRQDRLEATMKRLEGRLERVGSTRGESRPEKESRRCET